MTSRFLALLVVLSSCVSGRVIKSEKLKGTIETENVNYKSSVLAAQIDRNNELADFTMHLEKVDTLSDVTLLLSESVNRINKKYDTKLDTLQAQHKAKMLSLEKELFKKKKFLGLF